MDKYFNSDLLLRKFFDVKMKPGQEMKNAYIDEVTFEAIFKYFNKFFLFQINLKKIEILFGFSWWLMSFKKNP